MGRKHAPNVQRLALPPDLKGRGRQEAVEAHCQVKAILFREEAIDRKGAQVLERRGLHPQYQFHQGERFTSAPGLLKDIRQQDVLPGAKRVDVADADQAKQTR